ncbi:MAG: hypothetical protein KDA81_07490, partial [Planctomycetaceae bacterium]|nr:hypothetical protein [Planctomycetaceae bacterium]
MSKPDFKTLLLNHGEKAAAAIFGLLGLMAVSTADWSTDPRQPSQLQQYTSERKAAIEQNVWPDEDKALLEEIPDVVALAKLINTSSTDRDKFALRSFNQSPAPAREKRTSIAMLSPEEPLATAIVFPLAKPPEVEDETTESTEETKDPKDAKDSESMSEEEALEELLAKKFQLRDGAAGAFPGGGEAYPGAEGSYPGMVSTDPLSGGGAGYPGGAGGGAGYPGGGGPGAYEGGGYDAMYGGYDLEGMYGQGMMTVKKNIRVAAGVSVRMIVDLQKQRNIIRDALHLSGDYQVAQQHIQYVDLLVERRQKLDGSNQWGEWEPMSSEDLGEILEESLGIDRDVVSPAVTRNTITMPLPRRAAGVWTAEEASHPRVEDFELSAEEKALIDKFNQMVTERAEEEKLIAPVQVEQKGFSKFVQSATDIGSMYGNMAMESGGSYESSYDNMYSQYESQMGPGTKLTAEQRQLLDATKATADHRLLLVRFMDFTVERGMNYQYRVRVQMKNPNYNHPLDELEDPG